MRQNRLPKRLLTTAADIPAGEWPRHLTNAATLPCIP